MRRVWQVGHLTDCACVTANRLAHQCGAEGGARGMFRSEGYAPLSSARYQSGTEYSTAVQHIMMKPYSWCIVYVYCARFVVIAHGERQTSSPIPAGGLYTVHQATKG